MVSTAPSGLVGAWRVHPRHSADSGKCGFHDAVRRVQWAANGVSGLHCCHQRTIAHQVQYPLEVVGEHMQAHFRAHPVERTGEEMGSAHPRLQRAARMLYWLAADAA
ncbi:hypothetical protein D9M70_422280 [compost metagenome]